MATAAGLVTVEQFRQLPESEAHITELRNGEVVQVTRPKKRHDDRTYRIHRLLQPVADDFGFMREEFTYRPVPEYNVRAADLALVSWSRWERVDDDDYLIGAPEFIVEVASPSNSAEELQEKKNISVANGCLEFWIVYPKLQQVDVTTAGVTKTYRIGDTIVMTALPGHSLAVSDIFAKSR